MYHAIVRSRVRRLWAVVGNGDFGPAVGMAAPDVRFRFFGTTPISAEFVGANRFEKWFEALFLLFPNLRMKLTDVSVAGPPWNTTVVVRLDISATLVDGSSYSNTAIQWLKLRWGRMVSDEVLEDTEALAAACRIQQSTR
jgi:ketosteroid isomerase-like protein